MVSLLFPDANILQEECPLIYSLPQPKTTGVSIPSFPIHMQSIKSTPNGFRGFRRRFSIYLNEIRELFSSFKFAESDSLKERPAEI